MDNITVADGLRTILHRLEEKTMNIYNVKEIVENRGYVTDIKDTPKGRGFMIGKPGINVSPVLYYERMSIEDWSDEEAADYLIEIAEQNMKNENIDTSVFTDWDLAKDRLHLCACLVGAQANNIVVDRFYDIDKYVRVLVDLPDNDDSMASVAINYAMLEQYGVSAAELFEQALKCSHEQYVINDMKTTLEQILGEAPADLNDIGSRMIVLTTKNKIHGASAMFDNQLLSQLAQNLGNKDFYILPSSIHEILAVPVSDEVNARYLRSMVKEVNNTEVSKDQRLSYSVFYYDADADKVRKAG